MNTSNLQNGSDGSTVWLGIHLLCLAWGLSLFFLSTSDFRFGLRAKKERNSVYFTNLGIIGIVLLVSFVFGFRTYILIQLPILFIGGIVGLWLFYIQHNFEGVYRSRHDDWDRMKAALEGSSFYKLPKVLQWFTGNIGYHHIHHVRPMIPNYKLEECSDSEPELQRIKPLTIRKSLLSLRLHLWDEINQKLVRFHSLKKSEA